MNWFTRWIVKSFVSHFIFNDYICKNNNNKTILYNIIRESTKELYSQSDLNIDRILSDSFESTQCFTIYVSEHQIDSNNKKTITKLFSKYNEHIRLSKQELNGLDYLLNKVVRNKSKIIWLFSKIYCTAKKEFSDENDEMLRHFLMDCFKRSFNKDIE